MTLHKIIIIIIIIITTIIIIIKVTFCLMLSWKILSGEIWLR